MRKDIVFKYPPKKGLVSIIIPTHNRQKLLVETLKTFFNQSYSLLEIIIVDDHSNDNTIEACGILQEKDNRIVVLESDGHGAQHARNIGLQNSKGEYIQFFDDDDMAFPDYILERVKILQERELDYVMCDGFSLDVNAGNYLYERKCSKIPHNITSLLYYVALPTHSILLTRKAAEKLGEWDEKIRRYQDPNYYQRLFLYDLKGEFIEKSLYCWIIHNNSITLRNGHDALIDSMDSIYSEWKQQGKEKEIEDVIMVNDYEFIKQLFFSRNLKFFRYFFTHLHYILRRMWLFKIKRKDVDEVLHHQVAGEYFFPYHGDMPSPILLFLQARKSNTQARE